MRERGAGQPGPEDSPGRSSLGLRVEFAASVVCQAPCLLHLLPGPGMLIRFRTLTMEFVGWDDKTPSVRSAWARLCRILSFCLRVCI